MGLKRIVDVKVAELISNPKNNGHFIDISLLGTFTLECKELLHLQKCQEIQLNIPKFGKLMDVVIWVDKIPTYGEVIPLEKNSLLEAVNNINSEQDRLSEFEYIKSLDQLVKEVGRNFME